MDGERAPGRALARDEDLRMRAMRVVWPVTPNWRTEGDEVGRKGEGGGWEEEDRCSEFN